MGDDRLDDLSFWKRVALILALIAVSGMLDGCADACDAAITAKHEAEAADRKAVPPTFRIPLHYDATVTQMDRDGVYRTRFYSLPGNR